MFTLEMRSLMPRLLSASIGPSVKTGDWEEFFWPSLVVFFCQILRRKETHLCTIFGSTFRALLVGLVHFLVFEKFCAKLTASASVNLKSRLNILVYFSRNWQRHLQRHLKWSLQVSGLITDFGNNVSSILHLAAPEAWLWRWLLRHNYGKQCSVLFRKGF